MSYLSSSQDMVWQDVPEVEGALEHGVSEKTHAEAEIVLMEPEPAARDRLKQMLDRSGYCRVMEISDPLQMHRYLQTADPDLLVINVDAPEFDGPALVAEVAQQVACDTYLPILALGSPDPAANRRVLALGAKDYLAVPVEAEELEQHVNTLLDTRFVHLRLRQTRDLLEDLARRRTYELRQAQTETLELLGRVAELRDDTTGEHTKRVGRLSGLIAQELGLPTEKVRLIAQAAPLHDLGKVAITDKILLKEGTFETIEERVEMRRHAMLGAELLSGSNSEVLRLAREIAASHHERWDGQGYPRGLRGEEIPIAARIVGIADTFDALVHNRPYKPAWSVAEALAEIKQERGWQFDPRVVDALFRIQDLSGKVCSLQVRAAVRAQRV